MGDSEGVFLPGAAAAAALRSVSPFAEGGKCHPQPPGAPSQRSSAAPPPSRAVSRRGHGGCSAVSKQNDVCWSHTIAVERKGLGMSKERKARMRAEPELCLSMPRLGNGNF